MTDSLNDIEKSAVQAFYENEGMRESVKKVILDGIYGQGVLKPGQKADTMHNRALVIVQENREASDEIIGAKMRAFNEALSLLEHAFNMMSTIKKVEPKEPKKNQAR
jgi:predicted DNA-binding antitoxin AbrB/MazE fold protein